MKDSSDCIDLYIMILLKTHKASVSINIAHLFESMAISRQSGINCLDQH